jgi:threonine dehydratase
MSWETRWKSRQVGLVWKRLSWHDAWVAPEELVSLADIEDARRRLEGVAVRTPLDRSRALSERVGGEVFVKCENLQRTGSFKARGAYNRISRLSDAERTGGVVAASAGNHAQGVALAATLSGIRSKVFMPAAAPLPKVEATKRYGAEVVLVGKDFGEAVAAAAEHARECGATFVHPFEHRHVIAGQGTCGLEIVDQSDMVGTVIVPVGGGGLISGIAACLRALVPSVRIVGVQATGAASYPASLKLGEPVALEHMSTIADGIAANRPGELTFAHVQALVDEIVCVSDEAIAQALVLAAERMKLVLEPAGAAGVAALLEEVGHVVPPVVVVLSGGNIDPLLLLRVIRFGLSASGRYFAFHTRIADRPGELHRLLGCIAELGANVVGIEHHREGIRVDLEEVDVALQIETKGRDHIGELRRALQHRGYSVQGL